MEHALERFLIDSRDSHVRGVLWNVSEMEDVMFGFRYDKLEWLVGGLLLVAMVFAAFA